MNYSEVTSTLAQMTNIGPSHMIVPNNSGHLGYEGHCFPKDIQAMINFAKDIGIEPNTLEGAWQTNLIVRPEKDWEL